MSKAENSTLTDLYFKNNENSNESTYAQILSLNKEDSEVTVWSFENCKDLSALPEFQGECIEHTILSLNFVFEKFTVSTGTMGHYYLGLLFTTYTDFVVNIKRNLNLELVTYWDFVGKGKMYFLSKKMLLSHLTIYKSYFTSEVSKHNLEIFDDQMIWVLIDCNLVKDPIWKENREIEIAKTRKKFYFILVQTIYNYFKRKKEDFIDVSKIIYQQRQEDLRKLAQYENREKKKQMQLYRRQRQEENKKKEEKRERKKRDITHKSFGEFIKSQDYFNELVNQDQFKKQAQEQAKLTQEELEIKKSFYRNVFKKDYSKGPDKNLLISTKLLYDQVIHYIYHPKKSEESTMDQEQQNESVEMIALLRNSHFVWANNFKQKIRNNDDQ